MLNKSIILLENIDHEREDKLIVQILNSLSNRLNDNDIIMTELLRTLTNLHNKDQFHIMLIDRNNPNDKDSDLSNAYGYFSAYENNIYLVTDKSNFERKWLGLMTNYDTFKSNDISLFISTCLHELMHYACTNYFNSYVKIWRETIRSFIWNVFNNVRSNYFYDFVDNDVFNNITSKNFINSSGFKDAFDAYYNSLIINIKFRLKSLTKRYNDVLSTLYSKHDYKYARFFDNILVNAIKLQEGNISKTALKLYGSIYKAYIDIEPTLSNVKINNYFYQELLDFSEISCVLANYYKYAPKHIMHIKKTLALI